VVAFIRHNLARRIISEGAAKDMVEGAEDGGFIRRHPRAKAANDPLYRRGAKPARRQKSGAGRGLRSRQNIFLHSLDFFPADNPEILHFELCWMNLRKGITEGQVAGPVFKEIAERAANLPEHQA